MSLNGLFGFIDYLLYLVQSTNRHGVHSPFVYAFADQVLYGKGTCVFEPAAELCRKRMIQSKKIIDFSDSNRVGLSKLSFAKIPSAKYNRLLFRWVQNQQLGQHIVEIGSTLGVLPLYLQRGANEFSRYHIFDCSPKLLDITDYNLNEYECNENCGLHPYSNATSLKNTLIINNIAHVDLFVINQPMKTNEFWEIIDICIPLMGNTAAIIVNNINETPESQMRWKQLQNHEGITVCIDLFGIGMAFTRKEQQKESFLLRY